MEPKFVPTLLSVEKFAIRGILQKKMFEPCLTFKVFCFVLKNQT